MSDLYQQAAETAAAKLYRIRLLVEQCPQTLLTDQIFEVLNEPPPWVQEQP